MVSAAFPFPFGFIQPCQPTLAKHAPEGDQWLHEIKHDGYRIVAVKDAGSVRLWSRSVRDWTAPLEAIAAAVRALPCAAATLDGEAVAHRAGLPHFTSLRSRAGAKAAHYYVFDLIQLNHENMRGLPLIERKQQLAELIDGADPSLHHVEHLTGNGPEIFRAACRLGLEGIVSKLASSHYRSGRSYEWLKIKNPGYRR